MSKDFEIDKKELVKQIREAKLEKQHVKVEIIVAKGELNPICNVLMDGVGPKEVGSLYRALGDVRKYIEKEYPTAVEFANGFLKTKKIQRMDLED